ncbi:NAD(P)/FAD-dependent oxidoreductase [Curtobacterium sp. PhB115]|uniref:FAD-dependent oxidoreductase n=1 Tax=Curtobacterium sp. PhB115 TaxID=2485173 RepID=UPI000F4BE4E5|nr:NAD(P)/FAD-dependent oxidoreductase [Curtobacterium sp. PhB115]ROP72491.1 2-polyprenyl-6-methoxyphenol hydroxylase-like FAD-dependent oxidoreductase [Curtobacterium sp. PhB115]
MSSTDTTTPSIAVVGAGPGGLLAARVLQLGGIDVTVYDADPSLASRDQGGTLDLHADSGQIAIEDAQLTDEFAALARPEGQAHRLLDQAGTVLAEQVPASDDTAAPEIDRAQLRRMLVESLAPDTIRWGQRVAAVEGGTITFEDGTTVSADLVIGADGAWSRVRASLTDAVRSYTGVTFIEALFTNVSEQHPEIAKLVGDGHMWANGDGRTLVLQRNSGDVVRGYVSMRAELDWLAHAGIGVADGRGGVLDANGTQTTDTERVRAALRERFADFAPELLRVIDDSEGSLPNRPIFALPTPTRWEHRAGVTLLGDAAHVMSPFGGNGVNLALLDGAELARAIVAAVHGGSSLDDAVRAYEERMTARGAAIGRAANDAIVEHYAVGGPDLDSIPDFDAEADRWRDGAVAYRAEQQ